MQLKQIQKDLTTGRIAIPVAILITLLLRWHAGIDLLSTTNIIILVFHIGIALLLLQLNHTYTIIQGRTMFPAIIYLLLVGTDVSFFTNLTACGITLGFVFCFFCIFSSYQREDAQIHIFDTSILLAVGTIFWEPMILFLPLFWLTFLQFKAFNRKGFTASLLGIFIVCLFIFTWSMYKGDIHIFTNVLPTRNELFRMHLKMPDWESIIRFIFTCILVIISFIHLIHTFFSGKIRSRAFMYFFYIFIAFTTVLFLFYSEYRAILFSIVYAPAALVIGHFFTQTKNKYAVYLFLFSIVFYVGAYFWDSYHDFFNDFPWIDLN